MNDQERKKLKYIIALLRSINNEFFKVQLSSEECSLLIKYIDYLRGVRGSDDE